VSGAWHLLTGEYPPGCGGVGDYTRLVAHGLAARGENVHVWAPAEDGSEGDVRIHRVPGFGSQALSDLGKRLEATGSPRRILVQYAPQAFGFRGANVGFCRWVLDRARAGDEVRVMFHEPWVPFAIRPRRVALAAATRWMARLLLAAAHRVYVSVPAWEALLRPWASSRRFRAEWLPIPSTVPVIVDPAGVEALRSTVTVSHPVLGHFGTYGSGVVSLLEPALVSAMERVPEAVALLVGRGAGGFAEGLRERVPALADRIRSHDASDPADLSRCIQLMDAALQPYPDGATSRRTTLMAALAHGVAVASYVGRYSETIWREHELPFASDATELGALAARLLTDANARAEAGGRGRDLYERRFALEHTVAALLAEPRP
jgi:glycosyltransferase involved in cell wall biosynthesis